MEASANFHHKLESVYFTPGGKSQDVRLVSFYFIMNNNNVYKWIYFYGPREAFEAFLNARLPAHRQAEAQRQARPIQVRSDLVGVI